MRAHRPKVLRRLTLLGTRTGGLLLQNVLRISVTPQVDLTLKGSRAEVTHKGLVAGVFARVGNKIG